MIKVTLANDQKIYGLPPHLAEKVKEDLTIQNPAYINAKKYSKWDNVRIDPYLFYYEETSKYLTVPVGYTIPFNCDSVKDLRIEHTVTYPPFVLELRDTQKEAYHNYIKDTDKGLIVMNTGKGKSIFGIYTASRLKQKTLVIVHKEDLVESWKNDIALCFNNLMTPGLIKAKKRKVGKQITIATIQTLNRLSDKELGDLVNEFGMIIVDECHHAPASSYDILGLFNAPYKIGLSATPERADGLTKVMFFHFKGVAYQYVYTKEDEDILPLKVIMRKSPVEYCPQIVFSHKDYKGNNVYRPAILKDIKEGKEILSIYDVPHKDRPRIPNADIDTLVVTSVPFQNVVLNDLLSEYRKGRSLLVFLSQKEHCRLYKDLLVRFGIPENEILLYYGDAKEKSKELMQLAEDTTKTKITIATYSKAFEGTNVKAWEVAFLVSSIKDQKNTEQASGRIRRVKEGKINPVILYDYRQDNVYAMNSHGDSREARYKKLKAKIVKDYETPKPQRFTRGYNNNRGR